VITGDYSPEKLITAVEKHHSINHLIDGYYDGDRHFPLLRNAAMGPLIQRLRMVVGWPAIVIDVLEERLDFLGWNCDEIDMESVYENNDMEYESGLCHIDTLLYGVGFMAVHTGADGEPGEIITAESAKNTSGVWNRRTRRLDVGFGYERNDDSHDITDVWVYEPDVTIHYNRKGIGAPWRSVESDRHNLHRVPMVRLANRGRAGRTQGKTEITRSIRSLTDAAVRTLLSAEVNREINSAPQRYVLGAKEDSFTDANGLPIPGWRAVLGSLWNLERDEELMERFPNSDGLPKVGQFPSNPPGPYFEQLEKMALMVSAEGGVPPSMFGFVTDNPPSADSIRALEGRLIKRAERRQTSWTNGYRELCRIVGLMQGLTIPDAKDIEIQWRDPSTPTKAADADRAVKLTQGQNPILPADSSVTWDMVGLTKGEQRQLQKDRNKATFRQMLMQQQQAGGEPGGNASAGSDATAQQPNGSGANAGVAGVQQNAG